MDRKKPAEVEERKLTFLVIYMSLFIFILLGLGPSI